MTDISAKVVMDLRNKTGLSMMECKKALVESGGDAEKAENLLRIKLKGKMDARTDRAAGAGRIGIAEQAGKIAIVEIRAETDFTAMNEKFVAMVQKVADQTLAEPAGAVAVKPAMQAAIDELRITTGENCSFARGAVMSGAVIGYYLHHDGKTCGIVQAEGPVTPEVLKQVAMHVVANPIRAMGLTTQDIPAAAVEKEKKFRLEQAMESGKPQQIAEKMVEGGMKKFYEDVALLEQPFVMDPTKKIKDVIGAGSKLVAFARWQVGEQA